MTEHRVRYFGGMSSYKLNRLINWSEVCDDLLKSGLLISEYQRERLPKFLKGRVPDGYYPSYETFRKQMSRQLAKREHTDIAVSATEEQNSEAHAVSVVRVVELDDLGEQLPTRAITSHRATQSVQPVQAMLKIKLPGSASIELHSESPELTVAKIISYLGAHHEN